MPNPTKTVQMDESLRQKDATDLIRELAVRPPVKGMANVKAATEVFTANLPEVGQDVQSERQPAGVPAMPLKAADR